MNNPLISIITVVYNGAATLEQTILSVINQTYKNIEYIVIDGGSTDGTIGIIKKYADKLAYWVSEPDKGIYYAMNKGIDKATGEWINFMNSGDVFYENTTIETIFSAKYLPDILYGDTYVKFHNKIELVRALITNKRNVAMPFGHQSVFVRTLLQKKHKFNEKYLICADKDLFFRLYNDHVQYSYLEFPISIVLANGYSTKNRYRNLKEANHIYANYGIYSPLQANLHILKAYVETLIIRICRK